MSSTEQKRGGSNTEFKVAPVDGESNLDCEVVSQEADNILQEVDETVESFLSQTATEEEKGLVTPETQKTVSTMKRLRDKAGEIVGQIKQVYKEKKLFSLLNSKKLDFEQVKKVLGELDPEFKLSVSLVMGFINKFFEDKNFSQIFSLLTEKMDDSDKNILFSVDLVNRILCLNDWKLSGVIIREIDHISGLNVDVAHQLINASRDTVENVHNAIESVANHPEKFGITLDANFADELIRKYGFYGIESVVNHSEKFGVALNVDFVKKVFKYNDAPTAGLIADKIDQFHDLNVDIAFLLMHTNPDAIESVVNHPEKFGITLDANFADELFKNYGFYGIESVVNHPEKFGITLDAKFADELIERYGISGVKAAINHSEKFGINLNAEFATKVLGISNWQVINAIVDKIDQFYDLNVDIAFLLMRNPNAIESVINHPEKFGITLDAKFADELIEKCGFHGVLSVINHSEKFGITLNAAFITKVLGLNSGVANLFIRNINRFNDLNVDSAYQLINAGEGAIKVVIENSKKFGITFGIEFFKDAIKNVGLKNALKFLFENSGLELEWTEILNASSGSDKERGSEDGEEGGLIRSKLILIGDCVAHSLRKGDYSLFDKYPEISVDGEKPSVFIENFVKSAAVSDKGVTIISLCASKIFFEGITEKEFVESLLDTLVEYKKTIEFYSSFNIPKGGRTSLGCEYEITPSVGKDYSSNWSGGDFKRDISFLSCSAGVGQGNDSLHEIATRPTDNPALLLLELKLLQDLEFIDFNFDLYKKAAHGFHLTIGGETDLKNGDGTNFIQNVLVMSGWGGINAGREVSGVERGRGTVLRERPVGSVHSVQIFERPTSSVELRSLSIDSQESFERTVLTAYNCGIALQLSKKWLDHDIIAKVGEYKVPDDGLDRFLRDKKLLFSHIPDKREERIVLAWVKLIAKMQEAIRYHNEHFLEESYNEDVLEQLVADKHMSQEEFFDKTIKIDPKDMFKEVSVDLVNRLTSANNLFLKPSLESGGDVTNARAVLETTKIGGEIEDSRRSPRGSMFDHGNVPLRQGHYYYQKASDNFITHRTQDLLLDFNREMVEILSAKQSVDLDKAA